MSDSDDEIPSTPAPLPILGGSPITSPLPPLSLPNPFKTEDTLSYDSSSSSCPSSPERSYYEEEGSRISPPSLVSPTRYSRPRQFSPCRPRTPLDCDSSDTLRHPPYTPSPGHIRSSRRNASVTPYNNDDDDVDVSPQSSRLSLIDLAPEEPVMQAGKVFPLSDNTAIRAPETSSCCIPEIFKHDDSVAAIAEDCKRSFQETHNVVLADAPVEVFSSFCHNYENRLNVELERVENLKVIGSNSLKRCKQIREDIECSTKGNEVELLNLIRSSLLVSSRTNMRLREQIKLREEELEEVRRTVEELKKQENIEMEAVHKLDQKINMVKKSKSEKHQCVCNISRKKSNIGLMDIISITNISMTIRIPWNQQPYHRNIFLLDCDAMQEIKPSYYSAPSQPHSHFFKEMNHCLLSSGIPDVFMTYTLNPRFVSIATEDMMEGQDPWITALNTARKVLISLINNIVEKNISSHKLFTACHTLLNSPIFQRVQLLLWRAAVLLDELKTFAHSHPDLLVTELKETGKIQVEVLLLPQDFTHAPLKFLFQTDLERALREASWVAGTEHIRVETANPNDCGPTVALHLADLLGASFQNSSNYKGAEYHMGLCKATKAALSTEGYSSCMGDRSLEGVAHAMFVGEL